MNSSQESTVATILASTTLTRLITLLLGLAGIELSLHAGDITAPVLAGCPPPFLSFECDSDVPPRAHVSATDDVDVTVVPVFTETQSNPLSSCDNTIVRSWTAIDTAGNSTSCIQFIV